MFVCLIPFFPIALAEGLGRLDMRRKYAILAVAFAFLMAGSYAYAYTYHNMRAQYAPFFDEIKAKIPDSSRIIMPFNVQDCLYYSGKKCLRLGTMDGPLPNADGSGLSDTLTAYGADYVCCSSLNIDALAPWEKAVCDRYAGAKPHIDYARGGAWGRCWRAD
jgi:hypothetical protein